MYKLEDVTDNLWKGRPEWARPAVGGVALGLLLLALPEMYGVGYPVMDKAVSGHVVLWLLVVLMVGKVAASSLTLSIGGSGGVFAPSLFTGAMGGMAFGVVAHHLFGAVTGSPAIFAVVAMGAVFGAAAQAPLTAIASVLEMTGNYTLTLPVMLATGIAAAVSRRFTYGSIYTTKLLRRGIDIERPKPASALHVLTVADVMRSLAGTDGNPLAMRPGKVRSAPAAEAKGGGGTATKPGSGPETWSQDIGPVTDTRPAQALFSDEVLAQALRQLALYGRNGLPVVTPDGEHLEGWVSRQDVLSELAARTSALEGEAEEGALATEHSQDGTKAHIPSSPVSGYEVVEVTMRTGAPAIDHRVGDIAWPPGTIVVGVTEGREVVAPRKDIVLHLGERVILLVPSQPQSPQPLGNGHEHPG